MRCASVRQRTYFQSAGRNQTARKNTDLAREALIKSRVRDRAIWAWQSRGFQLQAAQSSQVLVTTLRYAIRQPAQRFGVRLPPLRPRGGGKGRACCFPPIPRRRFVRRLFLSFHTLSSSNYAPLEAHFQPRFLNLAPWRPLMSAPPQGAHHRYPQRTSHGERQVSFDHPQ